MHRIILITTLFEHENPKRMAEFRECIEINTRNSEIDRLIVFFEGDKKKPAIEQSYPYLNHPKITIETIDARPEFRLLFNYANQHFAGDYIVISNTDIFMDEESGIGEIRQLKRNHLWLLTRYNFNESQQKWILEDAGLGGVHRLLGSHDAWCFLAPMKNFENNILIGKYGCDGYLSMKALEASITVANPSFDIKIKHKHRQMHSYYEAKDYQTRKDWYRFSYENCFPPVSHIGQDVMTPLKHKIGIVRFLFRVLVHKIKEFWRH